MADKIAKTRTVMEYVEPEAKAALKELGKRAEEAAAAVAGRPSADALLERLLAYESQEDVDALAAAIGPSGFDGYQPTTEDIRAMRSIVENVRFGLSRGTASKGLYRRMRDCEAVLVGLVNARDDVPNRVRRAYATLVSWLRSHDDVAGVIGDLGRIEPRFSALEPEDVDAIFEKWGARRARDKKVTTKALFQDLAVECRAFEWSTTGAASNAMKDATTGAHPINDNTSTEDLDYIAGGIASENREAWERWVAVPPRPRD